jgi:ribonuclease HI
MCIRGRLAEFIKAKMAWFLGVPQPHEAEARGLKEAVKWLGSMGQSQVSIELDCKQVVNDIARGLNGAILDICKASLRIFNITNQ